MKKLFAIALLGLSLAGCVGSLPSLNLNNAVTLNTMLSVESAYGIALSGERAYKALPLCRTGTTISITNPCARRSVIVRLQAADLQAMSAIENANTFIKAYPTVDASNVIAAASSAVGAIKSILSANGVN
jgi:hypothetical protein